MRAVLVSQDKYVDVDDVSLDVAHGRRGAIPNNRAMDGVAQEQKLCSNHRVRLPIRRARAPSEGGSLIFCISSTLLSDYKRLLELVVDSDVAIDGCLVDDNRVKQSIERVIGKSGSLLTNHTTFSNNGGRKANGAQGFRFQRRGFEVTNC